MCHGVLATDSMTLKRSPGPVKFGVLEEYGMTGEYSVPFNLIA
jgi:hypothetical protein